MAGYHGHRAPNVSQYLNDLNTIPSPYDQAVQQQQQSSFNLDEELALFTNAEFFDFDKFGDLTLPTFGSVESDKTNGGSVPDQTHDADMKFLDFLNDGLDNVGDFPVDLNAVNAPSVPVNDASFSALPSASNEPVTANPPPLPQNVGPAGTMTSTTMPPSNTTSNSAPAPGPKRKHTQKKSTQESAEEAARAVAEDDKRRRNTAASARFRVKKKMREQALERTVKETSEKNSTLEARVSQLELENHWLRGIVMDKKGDASGRNEQAEKEITDMFKKFLASRQTENGSSPSESKHGVGTSA